MVEMSSVSRWWWCDDGCLIRLNIKSMLLRSYINMYVSWGGDLVVIRVSNMAQSFAQLTFWRPGRLSAIQRSLDGL